MSLFELRYIIESAIPWWTPIAIIGAIVIGYLVYLEVKNDET